MISVLVVSRNPAIGVGLNHHGYDVTDVRPDRHGDWTRQAIGMQAVVLELSDAIAADAAIRRLRYDGNGVRVLVVTNDGAGWDEVVSHAAGAASMPLPVTLPALMAKIEELASLGPIDVPPPPRNEEELLSHMARSVGLDIDSSGALVGTPSPMAVETLAPETAPPAAEPVAEAEPAPVPAEPAAPEPVAAEPAPVAADPVQMEPFATPGLARGMVVALAASAGDLTGVAETAEVVVGELAERIGAEAAALLLQDGDEWRVAGGVGLRPLEHRVRLGADHWLVRTVAVDGNGFVIEDTDAARDGMSGAPLASWRDVLAVPVPDVRGVFVAARSETAFDEASLRAAFEVATEAAPLLRDALAVRALARALAPLADLDD